MSAAGRTEFCPEGEPSREVLLGQLADLRRRLDAAARAGNDLADARMNRGLGYAEGMHARALAGPAATTAPATPAGAAEHPAAWAAGWREGWDSMDEHLTIQRLGDELVAQRRAHEAELSALRRELALAALPERPSSR